MTTTNLIFIAFMGAVFILFILFLIIEEVLPDKKSKPDKHLDHIKDRDGGCILCSLGYHLPAMPQGKAFNRLIYKRNLYGEYFLCTWHDNYLKRRYKDAEDMQYIIDRYLCKQEDRDAPNSD